MLDKWVKMILTDQKLLKYLAVGFMTVGLDIGTFALLDSVFGQSPIIANMISTLLAIVFNFLASNYWTFGHRNTPDPGRISAYLIFAGFNYIFGNALLALLTLQFSIEALLSKVLVVCLITSYSYFIYKLFIFREVKSNVRQS